MRYPHPAPGQTYGQQSPPVSPVVEPAPPPTTPVQLPSFTTLASTLDTIFRRIPWWIVLASGALGYHFLNTRVFKSKS